MMLNNLETAHSRQKRIEEARKEYQEALKIDRKQAQ
jgi:tetratricopeptide (TPR) repeat protein